MAALALLVALLVIATAYGAGGDLDPTFSGDGKVVTDFGMDEGARGLAIQADGKIIAVGFRRNHASDFALARYKADGSLDASFDGDGNVLTDFGGFDFGAHVEVQADGKIVAAGFTDGNFALARYNPDGSLDSTFDGDGKVTTDFGGSTDEAFGLASQVDGKIVAAGRSDASRAGVFDFALARYNPDGSLDPSFGGGGKLLTSFGASEAAFAVALQADGRIVAAGGGGSNGNFLLARYLPDGSLDPSFSSDGRAATDFGRADAAFGVGIQADGKIVAAGISVTSFGPAADFALARYNPDGSLDSTFDGDGRVVTDFGAFDSGQDLAIQTDGKIVAAGWSDSGGEDFALARYRPDGRLDPSFSGDGMVVTDFGSDELASDVGIQADGKIVAAGQTFVGGRPLNFALARYLPGAPRPQPLDHFLYYPIEDGTPTFQPRTVTVRDQFRTSQVRVVEPLRLLVPASKDGGRISRPNAHLKCYRIEESRFAGRTVSVQNQLGSHTFQVEQPTRLCNPASKKVPPGTPGPSPSGLDHFRCYGVEGSSVNRAVTLRDQFGTQQAVVEEPEYLCNPASKNGSAISSPGAHLVCYELGGVDPFSSRRASLRDQFGVQTFAVVAPTKLCVPSRKSPG